MGNYEGCFISLATSFVTNNFPTKHCRELNFDTNVQLLFVIKTAKLHLASFTFC
jgi:hypothetical protein